MGHLDTYTLILAIAVINSVFTIVYFFSFLYRRNHFYLGLWAASTFALVLPGLFYAHADSLPKSIVAVGTGIPIISACILRFAGARAFAQRSLETKYLLSVLLAYCALVFPLALNNRDGTTHTLTCLFGSVIIGLTVLEYWRDRADGLFSRYALMACYSAMALALGVQALEGTFHAPTIGDFGLPDIPNQAFFQLVALIVCAAVAAVAMSLAFEKNADHHRIAAEHDYLTGLYNRRAFEQRSEAALRNQRSGTASLILLDIDHFKSVNDCFGHKGGDQVLSHCAELIRSTARPGDILARIGGEEFALLLPATGVRDASSLAENIRLTIAQASLELSGKRCTLTVSAGVDTFDLANGDLANALQHADKALYQAKAAGRNRVETVPFHVASPPYVKTA